MSVKSGFPPMFCHAAYTTSNICQMNLTAFVYVVCSCRNEFLVQSSEYFSIFLSSSEYFFDYPFKVSIGFQIFHGLLFVRAVLIRSSDTWVDVYFLVLFFLLTALLLFSFDLFLLLFVYILAFSFEVASLELMFMWLL